MKTKTPKFMFRTILGLSAAFALPSPLHAADHGDGPSASVDRACDIGDLYFFKDPNSSGKVVLIGTVQGFIVPSEANNFSVFDPNVRFRFSIENSGDTQFDKTIDVTFSKRATSTPGAKTQKATIVISDIDGKFKAPVTDPTLAPNANAQVVTPLGNLGIDFFAGEVDDPFFFDIVGFNRFVAKATAKPIDLTAFEELKRGRDSFAGYNTLAIAIRVPINLLKKEGSKSTSLGVEFSTARHTTETPTGKGVTVASGPYRQIDREGVPAVNAVLTPFHIKNSYNASTPKDDADLKFGGDILATLNALGTKGADVFPPTDNALVLAQIAVLNGDILRLDTSAPSGFPNGRRLQDDVVDTLLSVIADGPLGDHVNANDINNGAFGKGFPYILPPQQPLDRGVKDDNTRN